MQFLASNASFYLSKLGKLFVGFLWWLIKPILYYDYYFCIKWSFHFIKYICWLTLDKVAAGVGQGMDGLRGVFGEGGCSVG